MITGRRLIRAKTIARVIVDEPRRLHEGVADRGAEAIERPVLAPHREQRARVADRRADLTGVTYDSGIAEQAPHVPRGEARDLHGIEPRERAAVPVALVEDRLPREAGLCAFEDEQLEEPAVLVDGDTPLPIVVHDIARVGEVDPRAARNRAGRRQS